MENILNEFLGIDVLEAKNLKDKNDDKSKEIAIAIVKLTGYDEWKVFAEELDRMLGVINKDCEYYASNPNQAWYDAGQKRSVQIIKRFVEKQPQILEQIKRYKKSNEENREKN